MHVFVLYITIQLYLLIWNYKWIITLFIQIMVLIEKNLSCKLEDPAVALSPSLALSPLFFQLNWSLVCVLQRHWETDHCQRDFTAEISHRHFGFVLCFIAFVSPSLFFYFSHFFLFSPFLTLYKRSRLLLPGRGLRGRKKDAQDENM